MKFTLKFDIQELDRGQVDVTIQVMKGATTVDTIELQDTTSNLVSYYTRRAVQDLFREMQDARRDNDADEESTAPTGVAEDG